MKHSIIILTAIALLISCSKELTPTKSVETATIVSDTRGKGAIIDFGKYLPNEWRYEYSGTDTLIFSDVVDITGGDSVYLHKIVLSRRNFAFVDFQNTRLMIKGHRVPTATTVVGNVITLVLMKPKLIVDKVKPEIWSTISGASHVSYSLFIDSFVITKNINGLVRLPVENAGVISCSPTEFY